MKRIIIFVVFLAFLAVLTPFNSVFAYHSPGLGDIYKGNYFKGPYVVYSMAKDHYRIELFLYPEWAKDKTFDPFLLTYKDKDTIGWKRFKKGDKLELDIRYEGKGNYIVSFKKLNTDSLGKEEFCCFKFGLLGAWTEVTDGVVWD